MSIPAREIGMWLVACVLLGSSAGLYSPQRLYAAAPEQAKPSQVNLNKAGLEEFETIQGIGPALAERILRYREEHGRFEKVEDLLNVSGIGQAKLERIKNQVSV